MQKHVLTGCDCVDGARHGLLLLCAGALFLLAFLWWGACCISTPFASCSYRHHKRVWTGTAAAALLLFVLQLLAQLLYGLHLLPRTDGHSRAARVAALVLEALGLGSMEGLSGAHSLLVRTSFHFGGSQMFKVLLSDTQTPTYVIVSYK
jgi:hypothetical protein